MDSFRKLQIKALRANFAGKTLFPSICEGMKCEAKTRKGTPCKNSGTTFPNGRCKFHGGMSTGPRTLAGKRASSRNSLRTRKVVSDSAESWTNHTYNPFNLLNCGIKIVYLELVSAKSMESNKRWGYPVCSSQHALRCRSTKLPELSFKPM